MQRQQERDASKCRVVIFLYAPVGLDRVMSGLKTLDALSSSSVLANPSLRPMFRIERGNFIHPLFFGNIHIRVF
jgi:hypothetical protein